MGPGKHIRLDTRRLTSGSVHLHEAEQALLRPSGAHAATLLGRSLRHGKPGVVLQDVCTEPSPEGRQKPGGQAVWQSMTMGRSVDGGAGDPGPHQARWRGDVLGESEERGRRGPFGTRCHPGVEPTTQSPV